MKTLSGEPLRTKFLDDEEAERLYLNIPELRGAPDNYCPTCFKAEGADCDCELQTQMFKNYMAAGIGSLYHRKSWKDYRFPSEEVRGIVEIFLEDKRMLQKGVGLFLQGSYGVGKTMLASLMLKELLKSGNRVYSTTFTYLMEMMTDGWKDKESQSYYNNKITRIPVLLIDDIGKEFDNRLTKNTFDNIIRSRVQSMKSTIITSNLTMEEIGAKYGEAVYSLLKEACLSLVMPNTEDNRKKSMEESLSSFFGPIV